jgi:hypothetical protein
MRDLHLRGTFAAAPAKDASEEKSLGLRACLAHRYLVVGEAEGDGCGPVFDIDVGGRVQG